MSFMDSVSTFTKGAAAKAKGNVDVVAMNAQVSTLKKEIASELQNIGQTYYDSHKDSPEEEYSAFFANIQEKEAKIAEIEKNIEETKAATAAVSLT